MTAGFVWDEAKGAIRIVTMDPMPGQVMKPWGGACSPQHVTPVCVLDPETVARLGGHANVTAGYDQRVIVEVDVVECGNVAPSANLTTIAPDVYEIANETWFLLTAVPDAGYGLVGWRSWLVDGVYPCTPFDSSCYFQAVVKQRPPPPPLPPPPPPPAPPPASSWRFGPPSLPCDTVCGGECDVVSQRAITTPAEMAYVAWLVGVECPMIVDSIFASCTPALVPDVGQCLINGRYSFTCPNVCDGYARFCCCGPDCPVSRDGGTVRDSTNSTTPRSPAPPAHGGGGDVASIRSSVVSSASSAVPLSAGNAGSVAPATVASRCGRKAAALGRERLHPLSRRSVMEHSKDDSLSVQVTFALEAHVRVGWTGPAAGCGVVMCGKQLCNPADTFAIGRGADVPLHVLITNCDNVTFSGFLATPPTTFDCKWDSPSESICTFVLRQDTNVTGIFEWLEGFSLSKRAGLGRAHPRET